MAASFHPTADEPSFFEGCGEWHEGGFGAAECAEEGAAVWVVGSFMNHSQPPVTSAKFVVGRLLMVRALCALKAGEEVTTVYSQDPALLLRSWGIAE